MLYIYGVNVCAYHPVTFHQPCHMEGEVACELPQAVCYRDNAATLSAKSSGGAELPYPLSVPNCKQQLRSLLEQ